MNEIEEHGFKALVENKDSHVKILVEVSPWSTVEMRTRVENGENVSN